MIVPADPKLITLSWRTYCVLLAGYPRRFRRAYREEIALVFRDCCREAYRDGGLWSLAAVWMRALVDLGRNALGEHVVQLTGGQEPAAKPTRSCSGCYSEVEPDWTVCKICGMVLNEGTAHPSHAVVLEERYLNKLGHAVNAPLKLED